MTTDRLAVNVQEAAHLISVPQSTIWREISVGHLRSFKLGRRRLIAVSDLEAYVNRQALLAAKPVPPTPMSNVGHTKTRSAV